MNVDDLKDQLLESFETTRRQVEESTVYIQLKEKYDVLDPKIQKAVLIGAGVVVVLFFMMLPMSFIGSSAEQSAAFQENRQLIKDLMKTDRQLKSGPEAPRPLSLSQLKQNTETVISNSGLLPEQVGITATSSAPRIDQMIPANIESSAVTVNLNKLNLQQVVDIGFNLQNIHDSIKMSSLDIQANAEDDHYFDVKYELTVFSVPLEEAAEEAPAKENSRRNK